MISGEMAGAAALTALAQGWHDAASMRDYERHFRAAVGRDLCIGTAINRRMASWDDDDWDDKVRWLRTVPSSLLVAILQSDFSAADVIAWLLMWPRQWPRLARWTFKALLDGVSVH